MLYRQRWVGAASIPGAYVTTNIYDVTSCLVFTCFSCAWQLNEKGGTERIIGGSAGAGVSFVGLSALILNCTDFEELLAMAQKGDRDAVDLLVRDVAGGSYAGVPGNMIASSFGRVAKTEANSPCTGS